MKMKDAYDGAYGFVGPHVAKPGGMVRWSESTHLIDQISIALVYFSCARKSPINMPHFNLLGPSL